MLILNRLQMRLFAAAMVFYVLVLTVQVDPFAHYMGAAAFFGLLAIPIRVVLVIVEIADSLTGGSPGGNSSLKLGGASPTAELMLLPKRVSA
jgi:hypothetical protein